MKLRNITILVSVTLALSGLLVTALWMRSPKKQSDMVKPTIQLVKERYESELMAVEGVVGVGISQCEGKACLKVFLANKSPSLQAQIPTRLDGFRVDTEVTGKIEALPKP